MRQVPVYKFTCAGYNVTYYGEAKRNFKVRPCEHLAISNLTGLVPGMHEGTQSRNPRDPRWHETHEI